VDKPQDEKRKRSSDSPQTVESTPNTSNQSSKTARERRQRAYKILYEAKQREILKVPDEIVM
jgi:hypothetical protein